MKFVVLTLFLIRKEYKFREVKYVSEALASRTLILLIPKPVFLLFHGDDSQCFRVGYAVLEESIKKMSYLKTLVFHLQ